VWWYDRNWHTHLNEPAQGIRREVWGMRLYHDITERFRPERRPLIMSNVQGIDNGRRNYPPHPAAHRYPFWWTGDTSAEWESLQRGIANAVDCGVISLQPYLSEDLTGHYMRPKPELYARSLRSLASIAPAAKRVTHGRSAMKPRRLSQTTRGCVTG